jgi:hypothetical protein
MRVLGSHDNIAESWKTTQMNCLPAERNNKVKIISLHQQLISQNEFIKTFQLDIFYNDHNSKIKMYHVLFLPSPQTKDHYDHKWGKCIKKHDSTIYRKKILTAYLKTRVSMNT